MARYKLVQLEYINLFTVNKSYFDFDNDIITKDNVDNVSLATIDAETTKYQNQEDFFNNTLGCKKDSDLVIAYNQLGEKRLNVVFNDPFLNYLANHTVGKQDGSINTKNATIGAMMYEIFRYFRDKDSGLLKQIEDMRAKDNHTYTINDHNYEFLHDMSSEFVKLYPNVYKCDNGQKVYNDFQRHFKSYKEFRALYLNYKLYLNKKIKQKIDDNNKGYTK